MISVSSLLRLVLLVPVLAATLMAAENYRAAIVMDAETGSILLEENADLVSPPASVTKLMTFLVVHDRIAAGALSLSTPVTTTAEASKTGGSQVYLAEKEVFTVEELLYALMINSANDAAVALATQAAGSRVAFVELMNAKARELGMTNTTFRSPHGLPPANRKVAEGDLTSPRDLAILSRHLLAATDVLTYSSVKFRVFRPGPKQIDMRNHNNLLGKVAGVDGLKTGFTNGAGFCLAATAQRNGRRLIVVTMGSPSSQQRDLAVAELFERGFAALPAVPTLVIPGATPVPTLTPAPVPTSTPTLAPSPTPAGPAESTPGSTEPPAVRFVPVRKKA